MHLRRYQAADFPLLAQWVTSPTLLFQFAGTDFTYPLTAAQIEQYQATYPERFFYIVCMPDGQPFGFGEIIPQDTNIPRLGRLLVGHTSQRGKGLGAAFVQLLVDECIRLYQCYYIELYVLTNNIQAQRCYEKVGFQPVPHANFQLTVDQQYYSIHKMRLKVNSVF